MKCLSIITCIGVPFFYSFIDIEYVDATRFFILGYMSKKFIVLVRFFYETSINSETDKVNTPSFISGYDQFILFIILDNFMYQKNKFLVHI